MAHGRHGQAVFRLATVWSPVNWVGAPLQFRDGSDKKNTSNPGLLQMLKLEGRQSMLEIAPEISQLGDLLTGTGIENHVFPIRPFI